MTTLHWMAAVAALMAMVHAFVLNAWRDILRDVRATPRPGVDVVDVTALVVARDEEDTLPLVLQDLHAQRPAPCQVVVVDDDSRDDTLARVKEMTASWPALHLLTAVGVGKKAAIAQGVEHTTGTIVLMSDADVRFGPLRTGVVAASMSRGTDLLLMPIRMRHTGGLLSMLQYKEQAALMGSAIGTGLGGAPVLANGANMAFRREAFRHVNGYGRDPWAGGDDMFLLRRIRQAGLRVGSCADPAVLVDVEPEPGWRSWWSQRLRWAGKMRALPGPGLVAGLAAISLPWMLLVVTAMTVPAIRLGQGALMVMAMLALAWVAWVTPVLLLVRDVEQYWGGERPRGGMAATLFALAAFMLYAPVIALVSIFVRPAWKGRPT